LIGCAVVTAASLPFSVPAVSGQPVQLAVGAVVLEFDRNAWIDIDLEPVCLVKTCPLAEIRVGRDERPVYRIDL
jgi:hypothetical protein